MLRSRVVISRAPKGAPARVERENGEYILHFRMNALFEEKESKTLSFCLDVELPEGCVCFIQSHVAYPRPLPALHVLSTTLIGEGKKIPICLTICNSTAERQMWLFDAPLARLRFVDAVPVEVVLPKCHSFLPPIKHG